MARLPGKFGTGFQALILPQRSPPRSGSQGHLAKSRDTDCRSSVEAASSWGCRVGCCQTSHKGQDGPPGKMSTVLELRNPVQICSNPTGIHGKKRRWKADESVVTSSLKEE